MFPFWESVIAPAIEASGARRIIEIGALRGETTALMLEALGPDAELHVVDPVPAFDPDEHVKRFPGRYVFHRDLSLNVLPDAEPFDVALIDGDHNWYTVYNELRLLRESSRRGDRPLPLLILHDVAWPYGRRDLYYSPEQIPAEFRQPYARRGMRPGRKSLLPGGGMNITLDNAEQEGGPRNGVMTALDDFVAEHDLPLRVLVIPIYFGLAIVAEERLLDERPELRRLLDSFESAEGREKLLELSEEIRIDATVFEHNVFRMRDEQLARANDRYLDLLRSTLLDQPYLENELRIEYLLGRAKDQAPVNADLLRAPASFLRKDLQRLEQAREVGQSTAGSDPTAYFPYTAMGAVKLRYLDQALRTVRDESVEGDFVECEPGRGGGGVYMRGFLEANEMPERQVWVAGTFRSSPVDAAQRPLTDGGVADLLADLNNVRDAYARFGVLDDRVRFLQGALDSTLADAPIETIAVVWIGGSLGAETGVVLEQLYGRLAEGGYVIVEDASSIECQQAIERFRRARRITNPLERVGWSGAAWRKRDDRALATDDHDSIPAASTTETGSFETGNPRSGAVEARRHSPLAPPAPTDAIDLSVVVVFYNMRREAARTLHSLSRAYQRGIDALRYEVIVVENGSTEDERLGEAFVRSFGPEFRYLDIGRDATPSPTPALNRAIKMARGRSFALMIDGAHVVTPGVLKFGMAGLRCYSPSIVATQHWYVGPGQQPLMADQGYDQSYEDELFTAIEWPNDGYRLFEIGHFIGDRDWFDGVLESNCLFVPRSVLEQVGGFDDSFSMPGGGYANLDLWERLGSAPDITMATILGEGSFHQIHGGTTTNDVVHDDRRTKIFAYGEHYEELRGRLLRGAAKPMHYVGSLSVDGARRTRSRRMTASAFAARRSNDGPDGVPATPEPMPDDLRTTLVESYWRGLSWKNSTWLGQPVTAPPTDLFVYQELIESVRPDWIIETGTSGGGRARFLASICDLLDHGRVISVSDDKQARPEHPRVTYVTKPPHEEATAAEVRAITGDHPHALVILGSATGANRIVSEFGVLCPLVPLGSYVVVENTIVNGHPVWPGYGPGPLEAVRRILALHGGFAQDPLWEKHGLTFNPGGYLRRIA
jgi:cephalosporin hydroxylase